MANAETRQYKELGNVTSTGTLLVRDNLQGGGVGAIFVLGTPDGVVNGTKGQLAIDVVTRTTYQNMDGATTWGSYTPGGTGVAQSVYGDGSDGSVTDPATLTRDMFYDVLSLSAGFVLNTGGFRLFAKQINGPTTGAAARIHRDGLDGNDGTASFGGNQVASPSSSGTLGGCSGGASGGGGGVTSAGGQGTTSNGGITPWNGINSGASVPGNSGAGGNGTGAGPGARVDKAPPQGATLGNSRSLPWSILMRLSDSQSYQVNGGHDGPGGGGSSTGGGGAGASGAGVVVVCARKMTGRLDISAKGGKGGNAHVGSGAGGGAGGGGGWLTVVCESVGPEVTMSAAGGAGGTRGGAGTGTDGTAGAAGVLQLYVS